MRCKAFFQSVILISALFFSDSTNCLGNNAPEIVPFELRANCILVEASVNGRTGRFIIDTGMPHLVLNSAFFKGVSMDSAPPAIIDFHGEASATKYFSIEEFNLGSLTFSEKFALVTDLRSIEKLKESSLFGIIGYSTLKHFELHFDFKLSELTFLPLGKKGEPVAGGYFDAPSEIFDLRFSDHIPFLITKAGDKKVRLGIDSGSEVNLLNEKFVKKSKLTLKNPRHIEIHGISGKQASAQRGFLAGLSIEEHINGPMDMTLTDLRPTNNRLPIDLHGILGIAYLKKVRFSINYKKKELCIWSLQDEAPLAESHENLEAEASLDGLKK